MTYDASNRKQIRIAEKAAEQLNATRIEFLRAALSTTQGRAWFYHFLADCRIFSVAPSFNPYQDYFTDGMRNAGMRTFLEIKTHCPDLYILMEQQEHARITALASASERASGTHSGRDAQGRVNSVPDLDLDHSRFDTEAGDPTIWSDGAEAE